VTTTVRRAGAFAAVATLALAAAVLEARFVATGSTAAPGAANAAVERAVLALPFAAVAVAAATAEDGPVFELFARPGDREEGRLYGLLGFSLAATGLGLLTAFTRLPTPVFVGSVFLLGYGNLAATGARTRWTDPFLSTGAFAAVGAAAGTVGAAGSLLVFGTDTGALLDAAPRLAFVGVSGSLLGALLRDMLFERDDPLVLLSIGLLSWLLWELTVAPGASGADADGVVVGATTLTAGVAVTVLLGYVSFALRTASVAGMLTGVLLALVTIVLGGFGWFAILISFFGLGALSTKFRYEEKEDRGVAEDNDGARGTGNVLGNSAVAMVAVVGFAAGHSDLLALSPELFAFAFAGSLATATSDTLSSEIGGLYDRPRLVTSFEVVEPGTDGAVTWQGELAGLAGSAFVAGVAVVGLDLSALGAAVVVLAGFVGVTVDSVLGATLEGSTLGNQGVNFSATLAGAVTGVAAALVLGLA
jgi:uncharacterized protein (TIGR00297 family)